MGEQARGGEVGRSGRARPRFEYPTEAYTMSVYFGNVVHRTEDIGTSVAMRRLFGVLGARGIPALDGTWWGDAILGRARSVVASRFLTDTACDVLVSIDSDMVFEPDDVLRLVDRAEDLGLVCGLYAQRNTGQPDATLPDGSPLLVNAPAPVEVLGVSAGFMAIHRRVLESIVKQGLAEGVAGIDHHGNPLRFWAFFHCLITEPMDGVREWLGEDFSFSARARAAGFPSWLDPSISVGHASRQVIYAVPRELQTANGPTAGGRAALPRADAHGVRRL